MSPKGQGLMSAGVAGYVKESSLSDKIPHRKQRKDDETIYAKKD